MRHTNSLITHKETAKCPHYADIFPLEKLRKSFRGVH